MFKFSMIQNVELLFKIYFLKLDYQGSGGSL